jgi:hemerythrin superfamily protein
MDALQLLEKEHKGVKALFRKLEKAEGREASALWEQIKADLIMHEQMEETYLYPPLKEEDRTEDLVLEAYEEHHLADLLIEEISRLRPSDEQWQPKIKVLQENIEHHIEEEEGQLFPKVRKLWDMDKRKRVGEQMAGMKQHATGSRGGSASR